MNSHLEFSACIGIILLIIFLLRNQKKVTGKSIRNGLRGLVRRYRCKPNKTQG